MNIGRSHGYLEGVGRLRLHYRVWEATDPRAGLLLIHGLSDHSGRYTELGEHMASVGLSTYALDLRGHGYSEGRRGHARSFELFLQDLERFRREVQGLTRPGLDLFLLGHSMGGLVVIRYLEEYDVPLGGAVLVSPWLGTALPVPRWKLNLARVLGRVLPALPIPAN
ncbi:MAG: alpha/beta fold hydrolase, partial [Longimicrobiales bacterium]